MVKNKEIYVVKRDGTKSPFDVSKIKSSIAFATDGQDVNPLHLEASLDQFIKNGITTSQIQDNVIRHAVQLATPQTPQWLNVAGRALAMQMWADYKLRGKSFYEIVQYNIKKGEYTKDLNTFYSKDDINLLERSLFHERDLEHSHSSLITVSKKYLGKYELNQHMHMVNAMRFGQMEEPELRIEFVKNLYDTLSQRKISLATPFMANLRKGGNTASCFIIAIEDDLDSIFENVKRIARISKNGGGLGIFLGLLRAKGSSIGGVDNAAGSITQWVKIINDTLVAVNQNGKRAGAGTVALPIWHNDIFDFLDMQTEHGDVRLKSYDVFPQITVPSIFMERDKVNGDWTTFCPYEVRIKLDIDIRGLYGKEFNLAYAKIEAAALAGKLKVTRTYKARDLFKTFMRSQFETGLPYIAFTDTINEVNPNAYHKNSIGITNANLCVAPETQVLTDYGYVPIQELDGEFVNIWNGNEFSNVQVKMTGVNQKLVRVVTSSGQELECTEYHKFYIQDGYRNIIVKQASELKAGDKLIKFDLPVIEGKREFLYAYDNGFFSADGNTQGNIDRIYLYHGKRELKKYFETVSHWNDEEKINRSVGTSKNLNKKYYVPNNDYSVKSRLDWLAGLCDGDGTIARNGTNESIQISSIHKEFLKEIQLMLQTLGVTSKFSSSRDSGYYELPKNDGSGEKGLYNCKETFRLLISSTGLFQLSILGFKTNRLKWSVRLPQRCAEQFIQIVDVIDEGRFDTTYCFSEPKRHMGMFNGILTGQCTESYSNVLPDKLGHVCNLCSINLSNINSMDELAKVSRIATRMLDYGIELTNNPDQITSDHNQLFRTIGIGQMGLHDYLAKNWSNFSDLKTIKNLAECIEYNAAIESVELAKKYGSFTAFPESKWANGEMTSKFSEYSSGDYDWLFLQSQIDLYGMRNSQLTSPAPTTSTSLYQDASASVLPVYSSFFSEDNKNGSLLVSSKYLSLNPLAYGKTFPKHSAKEIINFVSEIQKFTDTGISMELIFDQNDESFTAKDLYDAIHYAHDKKIKAIYYIRSIKKNATIERKEADCVACSG